MLDKRLAVCCLLGDRNFPGSQTGAFIPTPPVSDQLIRVSQGWLEEERPEGIGDQGTVDEEHRLTAARSLNR
jgi:hypothetical protein